MLMCYMQQITPLVDGAPVTMERVKAKLNALKELLPSPERMEELDDEKMDDLLHSVVELTQEVVRMVET